MVVLSTLFLATGLASLTHAAPVAPVAVEADEISLADATFVPAIGFGVQSESSIMAVADVPAPEILELTVEEFAAWVGNSSDAAIADEVSSPAVERRVIGADDRYYQSSSAYPYSAIGRLYMPLPNNYYSWCTGSLVGPRLMAAARHCINSNAQYYEFSPGYNQGNKFETAYVTKIVYLQKNDAIGNCDLKNDWALYVLNKPLGTARGTFYYTQYTLDESSVSNNAILKSAGYPGDRDGGSRLYQSDNRKTSLSMKSSCANGGPIIGDADVAGGMSGGPLWRTLSGYNVQYGTLYGYFADSNGNQLSSIHAHGSQFTDGISALNKENPA